MDMLEKLFERVSRDREVVENLERFDTCLIRIAPDGGVGTYHRRSARGFSMSRSI